MDIKFARTLEQCSHLLLAVSRAPRLEQPNQHPRCLLRYHRGPVVRPSTMCSLPGWPRHPACMAAPKCSWYAMHSRGWWSIPGPTAGPLSSRCVSHPWTRPWSTWTFDCWPPWRGDREAIPSLGVRVVGFLSTPTKQEGMDVCWLQEGGSGSSSGDEGPRGSGKRVRRVRRQSS